tara:strand:- start:1731 stop:2306 length:576 start_codon:yes stop_codon:yes gene_type:complete
MRFLRIIIVIISFAMLNGQISLPTFQAVNATQNTSSATPENPLQSSGTSVAGTNNGWQYLLGYRFTPQVNGTITQLGGYYNGTKTVYLWRWSDGLYLGSVSNSSSNNWTYTNLDNSISVSSDTEYYVAVAINGSGGSYFGLNLPQTYGNIRVNYTAYKSGNFNSTTFPSSFTVSNRTNYTYGLPDITFVPD